MSDFQDYFDEQMKDQEFKAEYDALQPEFAIIQAMINAREKAGLDHNE